MNIDLIKLYLISFTLLYSIIAFSTRSLRRLLFYIIIAGTAVGLILFNDPSTFNLQLIAINAYLLISFFSYIYLNYRIKMSNELNIIRSVKDITNTLLTVNEGRLGSSLNKTIKSLFDLPWLNKKSKVAIYLSNNRYGLRPIASQNFKELYPFNQIPKDDFFIHKITYQSTFLGYLITDLGANSTIKSKFKNELLQSVADTLGFVIKKYEVDQMIYQQQMQLIHSTKFSALGEMAGGVAHEINNPLAIINSSVFSITQELENLDLKNNRINQSLNLIENSIRRIAVIIKSMQALNSDGDFTDVGLISLAELLDKVLQLSKEKFTSISATLDIETTPDNCYIKCNESQIIQVLISLLNNSFEALKKFKHNHDDPKIAQIKILIFKNDLEIHIINNGERITEENEKKLFQPFFTTKSIGQGMGLSLSVSRSIINIHHGKLLYDKSHPQTCFIIRLPKFKNMNHVA